MKYIKGVYLNKYKGGLFNISVFLFLLVSLVLAVFATVLAVVNVPIATINRTSNRNSGAKPGDIIRYTVRIRKLDTVGTRHIKLVESLPKELEYLGNESLNYGDITSFNEVQVNEENYNLEFNIDFSSYLEDINREFTLSYDVRVLRNSDISSTINTISHMYCYGLPPAEIQPTLTSETYSHGEENIVYRKTSRIHMIKYINKIVSNTVSTKILWVDSVNLPEYVEVRLYRNAVPYSDPVRLDAANNWEHTWHIRDEDLLPSTPSNSSPSNAFSSLPVQWYVRQESYLEGYTSSLDVLPNNRFVFTNKYILNPNIPDNNNNGNNSGNNNNNNGNNNNNNGNNNNNNGDNNSNNNNNNNGNNNSNNNNNNDNNNNNSNNNRENPRPSNPAHPENNKKDSAGAVISEKERLDNAIKSNSLVKAEVYTDVGGVDVSANDVEDGAIITYHIKFENLYDKDLVGLRLREYIPEYTHYYSHSGSLGEYGYVNGKEHITWFVPVLRAGESVNLEFKVSKDYCVQGNIAAKLYYEVTGSESKPYSNMAKDPSNVVKTE